MSRARMRISCFPSGIAFSKPCISLCSRQESSHCEMVHSFFTHPLPNIPLSALTTLDIFYTAFSLTRIIDRVVPVTLVNRDSFSALSCPSPTRKTIRIPSQKEGKILRWILAHCPQHPPSFLDTRFYYSSSEPCGCLRFWT
jgi:hypothetical protein